MDGISIPDPSKRFLRLYVFSIYILSLTGLEEGVLAISKCYKYPVPDGTSPLRTHVSSDCLGLVEALFAGLPRLGDAARRIIRSHAEAWERETSVTAESVKFGGGIPLSHFPTFRLSPLLTFSDLCYSSNSFSTHFSTSATSKCSGGAGPDVV